MRTFVFRAAYLLLSLHFPGCGVTETGRVVAVSNPPVFRPKSPGEVRSPEAMMAAIITVSSRDLGLPAVEPYDLYLYRSYGAYAGNSYGASPLPEFFVEHTYAQPQAHRLSLNLASIRNRSWGSVLRYMAHEYAHNVEDAAMGAARAHNEWLREGFAEWVAAGVMDALGWESYASSLARAERALARYKPLLPKLSRLEDAGDWASYLTQPKWKARTYSLAFLAVHRLIEKKGVAGMAAYFRSEDFSGSFGLARSGFEKEMEGAVEDLAAVGKTSGGAAGKPEWKIGYRWDYDFKGPGFAGRAPNEVVREERYGGVPAYVVRHGEIEYVHAKAGFALSATRSKGSTVARYDPPVELLPWPLEVGRAWRDDGLVEDVEQKSSQRMDTETVVAGVERVEVPAGSFEAFRIETYQSQSGELISEHWYAPEVQWFVKSNAYRQDGVVEQALASFQAGGPRETR